MRTDVILALALAAVARTSPVGTADSGSTSPLATAISSTGLDDAVGTLQVEVINAPPVAANISTDHDDIHQDVTAGSSDKVSSVGKLLSRALGKRVAPKAGTYIQAAVERHNLHRANHGAGPVSWDTALADAALKSAKRCTFAHFMNENGLSYGQNLALGSPAPNIAGIITDQWYSEVSAFKNNYGIAQPDYGTNMENFETWGHFTQVVWKGSSKIGCATWRCDSVATSATDSTPMPAAYGGDVTYCNYQAPGNYYGQYANNIGRPKSNAKIAATYNVNQQSIAYFYGLRTGQKW